MRTEFYIPECVILVVELVQVVQTDFKGFYRVFMLLHLPETEDRVLKRL